MHKPKFWKSIWAGFSLRQSITLITVFAMLAGALLTWFILFQENSAKTRQQSSARLGFALVSFLAKIKEGPELKIDQALKQIHQAGQGLVKVSSYVEEFEERHQNWHKKRLRPAFEKTASNFDQLILTVYVKDTIFEWRDDHKTYTPSQYFTRFLERLAELRSDAAIVVHHSSGHTFIITGPDLWRSTLTSVETGLIAIVGGLISFLILNGLSHVLAAQFQSIASFAAKLPQNEEDAFLPEKGVVEAKELAVSLNEIKRDLERQVESRTRALVAISHDLRTPATRMKLRAELIEDDVLRAKMVSDLDEMTGMVNSTISFLRHGLDKEPPETIMFLSMMESICDDYTDVGKNVTLQHPPPITLNTPGTLFDPRSNTVDVDLQQQILLTCRPNSLRRAFSNVIDNALHYGNWARVTVSSDAEHVKIAILDGGTGLAKEEQSKVLEPFYRVDSSRSRSTGGTGLGLSVASSIVEIHGGEMSLANHAIHGLEVKIRLPRVTKRQAEGG